MRKPPSLAPHESITFVPVDHVVVDGTRIAMTPVVSSNVAALGFDPINHLLIAQFIGGATYKYRNVTASKHAELMASPSKGKYLQQHIVGKQAHPYERLSVNRLTKAVV